ncbi:hypothetical protein [Vibrio sp. OPT46]|uniref:hypothetical protein n=2 Tax=Vibrio sp. OPT46 TaxID=2778645 RepID=UPI0018813726|nr:hypothetical protein [Vibrio sp. OPT46]MBE8571044.1 hypothetical protein [Vibrio sp. OPT46]
MAIKTNILELNGLNPAYFTNTELLPLDDYLMDRGIYLFPHIEKRFGSIPLERVVGHSQGYDAMKWGDCLGGRHLKRIERALMELTENPNYYLDHHVKPGISFTKVEDAYFIEEGKHRTITARFLYHHNQEVFRNTSPLSNVNIHERFIDYEYMGYVYKINMLQKIYPELEFEMTYTDSNNERCLAVHPTNFNMPSSFFTRGEVEDCIKHLKSPNLLNKLRSHRLYQHIGTSHCLKHMFGNIKQFG